jgi:putative Mg2+ transporter-C (MgtC) family protein
MNTELHILMKVAIAAILAGLIGLEREKVEKPAGIRTNMLVGGAVALLVCLGEMIVIYFNDAGLTTFIRTDPTRVIQAIVVGISFIGAGMVLQIASEHKIKYLTTSATILFSSGIGIAVALEKYIVGVGTTIFILIINYLLARIERRLRHKSRK